MVSSTHRTSLGSAVQASEPAPVGIRNAAHPEMVTSIHHLNTAEIGLSVDAGSNVMAHPLYPSYCLIVRLLELSIEDYRQATKDSQRDAEVEFWRESTMFLFYGELVCELEESLHGRRFSLDDLRRGAEGKMGLPAGYLSPDREMSDKEIQRHVCRIKSQFSFICREVGNVPDHSADRGFDTQPRRRKAPAPKAMAVSVVEDKEVRVATA